MSEQVLDAQFHFCELAACFAETEHDRNLPPNEQLEEEDEPRVLPHKPFQAWVRSTFKVTIPKTAS